MSTLTPLQTRYEQVFSHLLQERQLVENLFCNVLEISDCSWDHVIYELDTLACNEFKEFDIIYQHYEYLDELLARMEMEECEQVRWVSRTHSAWKPPICFDSNCMLIAIGVNSKKTTSSLQWSMAKALGIAYQAVYGRAVLASKAWSH